MKLNLTRAIAAASLAAVTVFNMPGSMLAQTGIVTIKPKPMSQTFKKVVTQTLSMEITLNGKMNGKTVKNQKIQFDIVEDRGTKSRIVTFGGSGLSTMLNDDNLSGLGLKSMSVIQLDKVSYISLSGKQNICLKPKGGAGDFDKIVNEVSADKLLKNAKLDATSFSARLVKAEKVGGEPAKKYEIETLLTVKDKVPGKQFIWIADNGGYIVKFETAVPSSAGGGIAAGFEGEQRIVYTIVGINKPVKIAPPASCKNAIAA